MDTYNTEKLFNRNKSKIKEVMELIDKGIKTTIIFMLICSRIQRETKA